MTNAFLILALGAAGGTVGLIVSLLLPRPYVDSAVVEVGIRSTNEPIENPIQAGWRLRGALYEAARDLGVPLEATIYHRREEKTNELTRFMDIIVSAETASTARTILDRGLAKLTATHRQAHEYERDVVREQLETLERMAARLEQTIHESPATYGGPSREMAMRAELDALNARLFEVTRAAQVTRATLSDVRTPPTRIVARAPKVEEVPARTTIWVLSGVIFGLMIGLSAAAVRLVSRERGAPR